MALSARLLAGLLLAILPFRLSAQTTSDAAQTTTTPSARWEIDADRSTAHFDIHLRLVPDSHARTQALSGGVTWLPGGRWQVAIEMHAPSLRFSGPAWVDRKAKSMEFLDVERHPRIRFDSEPLSATLLHQGGELRGQLVLRGVRKEVALRLDARDCARTRELCVLNVSGTVSREAFGMVGNRWAVKDNIDFRFRIHFNTRPATRPAP